MIHATTDIVTGSYESRDERTQFLGKQDIEKVLLVPGYYSIIILEVGFIVSFS